MNDQKKLIYCILAAWGLFLLGVVTCRGIDLKYTAVPLALVAYLFGRLAYYSDLRLK